MKCIARSRGGAFRVYGTRRVPGLLALLAVLAPGCARRGPALPSGGNVLVVSIDTLRADRVGALGGPPGLTPNLDRLAARGAVFTNAFTPAPLTLPAHTSLFSGRWPFRHGVRVNGTDRVDDAVPLLAAEFRRAGFATGAVIGSLVLRSEVGLARGFDLYDESFARNAGKPAGEWTAERPGEEVVDRAIAWLDGQREARFFLWVHLYDPHAPYDPPPPFKERFSSPYDGEVAAADAALGRLLAHLEKDGRLAKTLVAVAGDHGESLGEHGEETHGVFLYDATLHVPLVIVPPGAKAVRVTAPVSLVDLAPTLREAATLPADAASDGVSLGPQIRGEAADPRVVYAESVYPAALLGWSPLRAARDAKGKYIEAPKREYYDLERDPRERKNCLEEKNAEGRDLARQLAKIFSAPASRTPRPSGASDEETVRRLASLGYMTPFLSGSDLDRIDATRTDPKDRIASWPAIERAVIARQLGRPAEAADLLSALDPAVLHADPVLLRELALVLRRSRRAHEAVATYKELLGKFPAVAEDWFGLGISWHLLGRGDEAASAHVQAVRMKPDWRDAWINLGQEYLALGKLDQAREAFVNVVALDGRSVDGLSGLAAVAAGRNDLGTAAEKLKEALGVDPERAQTLENLARVERERGNRQEAERLFRRLEEVRTRKERRDVL